MESYKPCSDRTKRRRIAAAVAEVAKHLSQLDTVPNELVADNNCVFVGQLNTEILYWNSSAASASLGQPETPCFCPVTALHPSPAAGRRRLPHRPTLPVATSTPVLHFCLLLRRQGPKGRWSSSLSGAARRLRQWSTVLIGRPLPWRASHPVTIRRLTLRRGMLPLPVEPRPTGRWLNQCHRIEHRRRVTGRRWHWRPSMRRWRRRCRRMWRRCLSLLCATAGQSGWGTSTVRRHRYDNWECRRTWFWRNYWKRWPDSSTTIVTAYCDHRVTEAPGRTDLPVTTLHNCNM